MRRAMVLVFLFLFACSPSGTPNPQTPEPPGPVGSAPTPSSAPSSTPATHDAGAGAPSPRPGSIACGGATCTPPEQCITVSGRTPDSTRKECWITCAHGQPPCPSGMTCTMIYDGPGEVCTKVE